MSVAAPRRALLDRSQLPFGAVRRYFGTDGVRGIAGEELTDELVAGLGWAFATWSGGAQVLLGRDTRASGSALEAVLAEGLASGGADVLLGGVLPTPAVALLATDAGAVVSASHNPPEYNGVKFFRAAAKLTDAEEEEIEELLGAGPSSVRRGSVERADGLEDRYVELVCQRFGRPLDGLRIVLDCANGAMFRVAPEAFRRAGATVTTVADSPDGDNINVRCGATDLTLLSETVATGSFDLGLAFDGDGDRLLAVDADGQEVDGDQIVAILALHLGVGRVAVTQMTNLGFHRLMGERGIEVTTTEVGDRYVLEALRRDGSVLGGEQSGHIIILDGHVSGDGLAAALLLCGAVTQGAGTLAAAAAVMPRFPQAKANVRVRTKAIPEELRERVAALNERLAGRGRLLVRPSGTEPVVRVLAEAESEEEAVSLCGTLRRFVEQELG